MKVEVFGTRVWSMPDKKTGEILNGITAYYTTPSTSKDIKGLEFGKFAFLTNNPMFGTISNLNLPAKLDLEFNRRGKVCDFEVLE